MTDYLGQKLEVGSVVVSVNPHRRNVEASFGLALVVNFTPCKVKLVGLDRSVFPVIKTSNDDTTFLKDSSKLVILNPENFKSE